VHLKTCAAAPFLLLVIANAAPVQRPVEIEANALFRESFIAVMEQQPGEWQLQPQRPRGHEPEGRVPFAYEEMTWRQADNAKAFVTMTYWRYSSTDDARAHVRWYRELLPVTTFDVKDFADEAFWNGSRNVTFRRGSFVFLLSTTELETRTRVQPFQPPALARQFLDAADRVLMTH
jgi:hypothetical protein